MPAIKSRGTISGPRGGEISFKNIGGKAKILEIKRGPNNNVALPGLDKLTGIEFSTEVIIIGWSPQGDHTKATSLIDLEMILEDIDRNKYLINISGPVNKPEYSDPEEINKTDPAY